MKISDPPSLSSLSLSLASQRKLQSLDGHVIRPHGLCIFAFSSEADRRLRDICTNFFYGAEAEEDRPFERSKGHLPGAGVRVRRGNICLLFLLDQEQKQISSTYVQSFLASFLPSSHLFYDRSQWVKGARILD